MPSYYILKPIVMLLRFLRKLLPAIKSAPDEIRQIPSREPNRTIKLHIYHPPDKTDPQPTPVLITFCGSGFVMPGHGLDDAYCQQISREASHTVIDVQYRLAPEHPCPAALHDAADVLAWVQSHPELYDPSRISIGGFSAGATIAISTAAHTPSGVLHALIAFYPACDMSISPYKKKAPDQSGTPLPPWLLALFRACYLRGGVSPDDARVSPVRAEPGVYPKKCLFVTAAQCNMAVEAEDLANRIGEVEGKEVVVQRFEGCGHAWDKVAKVGTKNWDKKVRAYGMVVELLRS
ncbi:hypothetical protein EYZ11_002605 [Aspergillus tanneri]|uniref:Alpha/beta hydrolase fold-3 domain-containing protein n=1 Tax=Aspergillus tanneri TaxID=1220188 RepID=A0A4S3JSJ8_9EURO|nr:uncharacterized protein ATNIH1004_000193 [Aspergillus tanneri]KAA8651312.1 hypothetical protein ATNIH1004_000193 [Aspergillus tanneri]THC97907.1 hypothetical protein EYZ11_002605 [Aspergillus tanneri]